MRRPLAERVFDDLPPEAAYMRFSRAWRERDPASRVRALAEAPAGSQLARAGALFLTSLDIGTPPFAAALVQKEPAAYARLIGDGRAPDGADSLPASLYFRRFLDTYRSVRNGVFGAAFRWVEPQRSGDVGLVGRVYPALGGRVDWGFCLLTPNTPDLVVEEAGHDEYPEWGGLDRGWPWWYPRGVRTVYQWDISGKQRLPEHYALGLVLEALKPHVARGGIGLDESACPALATVRAARHFWGAVQALGPDARRRMQDQGHPNELDVKLWLREIAVHRHRMALLAQMGNPGRVEMEDDRRARWQQVIAEAERRTQAGEPPPNTFGGNNDVKQFEAALRALRAGGFVTLELNRLPSPDPTGATADADGTQALSLGACAAYLEMFFRLALDEYRALVRCNTPVLERALPRFGQGAAVLHVEVFLRAEARGPRNLLRIGGQTYVVPVAAVRRSWFTSGGDQNQVSVAAVTAPTYRFGDLPLSAPWLPNGAMPLHEQESGLDSFFQFGYLLEQVYEWLNEDFHTMFGDALWSQRGW